MITLKSLCAMLQEFDSPDWQDRAIDGRGSSIERWLPVVSFEPHRYGLLSSGHWVAEYADRARVTSPGNLVFFLPLMERTHSKIVSLLKTSVAQSGLPEVVVETFPLDGVVECAIKSSSYWRGRAESWIVDGYPLNHALVELLPENAIVRRWQRERLHRVFGNG